MADEPATSSAVDAPLPTTAVDAAEPAATDNDDVTAAKENGVDAHEGTNGDEIKDAAEGAGEGETAASDAAPAAESAATPGSKDKRRKSAGGVPEHKGKKLNKKKSMPTLHLGCKPGDHYWARLKGYPPWPSVICDEEMLPESLLATRPVSTARPDGSIREDFQEGGKNAKERTFPIMFLYTNEFQWMVNTSLTPLDPEECKNPTTTKMTKALQGAYDIAVENHDLEFFKEILRSWQEEEDLLRRQEAEAQAEAERLAAEKAAAKETKKEPKKKAPRKSKGGDEDVDMDEVEAPKSSKKRKKEAESDAETPKPKKTPKVKALNAPKTNGDTPTAKSSAKPKKKFVPTPQPEAEDEAKPQLSEEERLEQRKKAILYLRHRLQKGFVSRDQAPQESEMAGMAAFFQQLESYENLEPLIIRDTKIHKVLKAIVKLASIPKDDEFNFKKRSAALLEVWNKRMEDGSKTDGEGKSAAAEAPQTNGSKASDDAEPETGAAPAEDEGEDAKDDEKANVEEESAEETKEDVKDEDAQPEPAAASAGEKTEAAAAPADEPMADAES